MPPDKIVLNSLATGNSVSVLNANFQKIEDALNNKVLYRDNPEGAANQMESDLDMNGKRIYNLPAPSSANEPARLQDILDFGEGASYGSLVRVAFDEEIPQLPDAVSRANKLMAFDNEGNPTVTIPSSGDATALANDLANTAVNTKGAGMVGYSASLTYAANTVGKALKDLDAAIPTAQGINVLDFIPEAEHAAIRNGTSTYDCRANIQAAIDSLGVKGGRVFIPRGTYEMTDFANRCLLITAPIHLVGEGFYSALKPKSSVNALTNCIQIAKNPLFEADQMVIEGIHIGDPTNGTRSGLHGIFIDTQVTGSSIGQLKIRDCFIGESTSGNSIFHLNNPANNVNGGLYCSTIAHNQLRGGIRMEASGDSNNILYNVISSTETNTTVGIYASLTTGASQLNIIGNNITTKGGAITIDGGGRINIISNNMEQIYTIDGFNSSSMVNLSGANGTITMPYLALNNLFAYTGSGIIRAVRVNNTVGGKIEQNTFLPSSNSQWGIVLLGTAQHMSIGWNQYGTDSLNRVSDGGIGTIGVARNFASLLTNGWVIEGSGSFADCTYIKDDEGYVTVQGVIKSGTVGTILSPVELFTLPEDYRPAKSIHIPVYTQDTSPAVVPGNVLVNAALGRVFQINGSNGMLSLNLRFLAAKPATSNINSLGYGAGHTANT